MKFGTRVDLELAKKCSRAKAATFAKLDFSMSGPGLGDITSFLIVEAR